MPITPDLPFPKSAGDAIRSKDWNDLVTEAQRLDNAKVNRASDAITGPLTIAGALALGSTSANAKLHVVDSNTPAALRIQSTHSFGQAQLEFWSDPQGSATEWRPGLIQSLDTNPGNFTGGLSFLTNGTGAANRTGLVEAMRLVNGNVGIGVPAPGFKIDVGDRIRLRQGTSPSAGLWLYQTIPAEDRAFVGMNNDNIVGLYGNKGAGWGLNMDVTNGNLGVRANPIIAGFFGPVGLFVDGGTNNFGILVSGGTTYGIYTFGRSGDQKIRSSVVIGNQVSTTSTDWVDMPNMSLAITAPIGANFQILVQVNGVQAQGSTTIGAYFRLLVDGNQYDFTRHEFNNNGWELRGVFLSRLAFLAAGSHTISVQWFVTSGGTLTCCWYGDFRQIQVIEL
jgi:hypothetical protein